MNVGMLVLVVLVYLAIGMLANELGLTASVINPPEIETSPATGVLGVIDNFGWLINAAGSLIQLITFQWDAPAQVRALLGIPLNFAMFYSVLKLWGGGG